MLIWFFLSMCWTMTHTESLRNAWWCQNSRLLQVAHRLPWPTSSGVRLNTHQAFLPLSMPIYSGLRLNNHQAFLLPLSWLASQLCSFARVNPASWWECHLSIIFCPLCFAVRSTAFSLRQEKLLPYMWEALFYVRSKWETLWCTGKTNFAMHWTWLLPHHNCLQVPAASAMLLPATPWSVLYLQTAY